MAQNLTWIQSPVETDLTYVCVSESRGGALAQCIRVKVLPQNHLGGDRM